MATLPTDARSWSASILKPLAVGVFIALCCWVSLHTRVSGGLSMLWISSGVLIGVLLTSARNAWGGLVLAAFVGNMGARALNGDAWYSVLGLGFASTLDAFLVAYALVRYVGNVTDPAKVKLVSRIAVGGTIGACLLSGAIAASTLAVLGRASFGLMFTEWFISHALGIAICATLTVVGSSMGLRLFGRPGHRLDLALSVALVAATCFVVFKQSRYPLLFFVYPPLLLATFRHRFSGLVFGVAIVAGIAISETVRGSGPFFLIPDAGPVERVVLLQVFIASACMMAFPVAVVLTDRALLVRNLRERELLYRTLADHSSDLVMRIAANGWHLYISPSAKDMLGWDPGELARPRLDLLHPDDAANVTREMKTLYATGISSTITYRALRKDGHYIWIEAQLQRVLNAERDGEPEIIYSGRDVTRRVEVERELAQLARYDGLTGLANRFHFNEHVEAVLARHRRSTRPLALLYLDIDFFKRINDSLGHAAGDEVLREFAQRLKGCLRITDFAARLGGDEFVVLVEDADAADVPELIARKVIAAMQSPIVFGDKELHITTSVGIAFCCRVTASKDELLHAADQVLYVAKVAGRNTYRLEILDASTEQQAQRS